MMEFISLVCYIFLTLVCVFLVFCVAVNLYVWYIINGGTIVMYTGDRKLNGKTVLITGGNAGVGKATATELASRGARVILACRNENRARETIAEIKETTGNSDVSFVECDLADFDSIRLAAKAITDTEKRIDVLINNAAVFSGFTVSKKDEDLIPSPSLPPTKQNFDSAFGVNHLGHFLLTNLLLDLLKSSAPSRIINVSSTGHSEVTEALDFRKTGPSGVRYPRLVGYHISKLANVLHAKELANRLGGTGVTTYVVNPGAVFSDVALRNQDNYNYSTLKALVTTYLAKFAMLTPAQGSQTILYCALDEGVGSESGEYYDKCSKKQTSGFARDNVLARRLWEECEIMIQES